MARTNRFGDNQEPKRIKRKPSNISSAEANRNIPSDPNKDGYGSFNYDPVHGWVQKNYFGAEAEGVQDGNYSTNYLRRSDGLPGSRV